MTRGRRGEVVVPVADIRGGERRKVVLRVAVTDAPLGSLVVSTIELRWRRVPDGAMRTSRATADVEIVDEPGAVAESIDPLTVEVVERARSAHALEEAAAAYERDGMAGATWVSSAARDRCARIRISIGMWRRRSPRSMKKQSRASRRIQPERKKQPV